jgi:3-oxoacyl-[acyl-carrier protein] reductase
MKQFEGRTALVTGGSSGIGMETCRLLAEEGAAVAIHYFRSKSAADSLVDELGARGAKAMSVQADVTRRAEAHRMVDDVRAELGKIDLLVNNAGNILGRKNLTEETGELWQATMDLNLNSLVWVTQRAVTDMIDQAWGRIVNLSSAGARFGGTPGVAAYVTAKAGVLGLTKAMANEFGQYNINVNAILPGWIDTPFHVKAGSGDLSRFKSTINIGRIGTPEEVASVVVFLLSDSAKYMQGAMIDVNGGTFMP